MNRTPAYWPTRILLGIGIMATVFVVGYAVLLAREPFVLISDLRPPIFGMPQEVPLAVVGAGLAVVGLVWMVRIFRGPRDEPPRWRYRDRR
jgi:hypothetical protein